MGRTVRECMVEEMFTHVSPGYPLKCTSARPATKLPSRPGDGDQGNVAFNPMSSFLLQVHALSGLCYLAVPPAFTSSQGGARPGIASRRLREHRRISTSEDRVW